MDSNFPFPTVKKLLQECGTAFDAIEKVASKTHEAETRLREVLQKKSSRLLNPDVSLVLNGSFARHEIVEGSDYDWTLLVDGVVDNEHAKLAREIHSAIDEAGLKQPGTSGTFGNLVFSHELVHRIGGGADSNANLTRRVLMLLESRPFSLSEADSSFMVWDNVLGNILKRYFEEDVHFTPDKKSVPRFLLNDLTRYWRTVCVDYAAKHREQDGKKWAIRNAKLRFSRKLIYATGLAFSLSCQLDPPPNTHTGLFGESTDHTNGPFVHRARKFARTPSLEFLAAFVDLYVVDADKKRRLVDLIFGSYNWWLKILNDDEARVKLEDLDYSAAGECQVFQDVRRHSKEFAKGLELLFFNRDHEQESDQIARVSMQYIGF